MKGERIDEYVIIGDYYLAFSLRNVPILWFFTGLHPDYHTPDDEIDRIDWDKLTDITKEIYLSIRLLASYEWDEPKVRTAN